MSSAYETDRQRRSMLATMNGAYKGDGIDLRQVGTALYKNDENGHYADVQVVADADGETALISYFANKVKLGEAGMPAAQFRRVLADQGFTQRAMYGLDAYI